MAHREFTASDGTVWQAWDVVPGKTLGFRTHMTAPELSGGWLCFQCDAEKRRLAPIPEGWDTHPDDDLEGHLSRAGIVAPRPAAG
ncbi:MAG TPA: hypothetical protein VFE05_11590 [Longimicrobiaceae bacterium]|jgi:hypothetical protein|nr:hypothetical protein [Longimicrobiaceae bacterium]